MNENQPKSELPLSEWPVEMLEARMQELEIQIVEASKGNDINQENIHRMQTLHSKVIDEIMHKKGQALIGKISKDSWEY